ncbi:C2 domain/Ankyrin repeats (3 copies)/Ankyrin repeat [Novymonas esmeraldas]|uniref:C2 domain/Ankyrin repeats (3 copies)/Ankyrin repeat n=1 Tax=Novymonas esmeraldas TaxID=1808958 RepID=A0AAW0F806_9TRYP
MSNAIVTLTVERAEALVPLNPGGTSNPYITASIGAQCVATPVMAKTLNPNFHATFTFHDCPLPAVVSLRAFNKIQYVDVEDPLGTATLTIFDLMPETTTKVVQLSHGGVAALAQRAPNGCGAVTVAYSVAPMPPPAMPEAAKSSNSLPSSAAATPLPMTGTPLAIPASHNIAGDGPASIPVASIPRDSRAGTPGSVVGGPLFASNPSTSNPAATTPKLRPVDGTTATTADGTPALVLGATQQQQRDQLTPPSLTPARLPATATYYTSLDAPAPPLLAAVPMPVKLASVNGYESYAVPGARLPPPAAVTLPSSTADDAAATLTTSAESYYANNSAVVGTAAPPPSATAMLAPLPSSLATLPVAPSAAPATRFASLQESTNATALSLDAQMQQQQSASASSLFTAAAQAPSMVSQTKLLVVPPHISGTATPTFFHASQGPSRDGSRLASAALLLPPSLDSASAAFPSQAPPPLPLPAAAAAAAASSSSSSVAPPLAGALPVATVPRSPPLSFGTANSRRSTPANLPSLPRAGAPLANAFPAAATAANARGIAAAPATAGLRDAGGAAFPRTSARPEASTTSSTSPKRRSPRSEGGPGAAGAAEAITSAAQLYADPQYLLEAAATGSDVGIFDVLRAVDPSLTEGFLGCRDYAGRSLLHVAAWGGQLRVLQTLLSPEPVAPMLDLRSVVAAKSGNTILHAAACGGHAEVAQWLRYSHPTAGPLLLHMRNARGMTAAECAMEAGFSQVARILIPS